MRHTAKIILTACLLTASLVPALARPAFSGGGPIQSPNNYPGAPRPVYDDPKPPYAMNYTDEAAQSLGIRNARLDVFSTKPPGNSTYLPSVTGGLGGDGAMLKLQWHPGE